MVWAYAGAGVAVPGLFHALLPKLLELEQVGGLAEEQLGQLYYAMLFTKHEAPELELWPDMMGTPALERRLRDRLLHDQRQVSATHNLALQKAVSQVLESIGWEHQFEYETEEGLSVDMGQPAFKRAVEFYGPTHYLTSAQPVTAADSSRPHHIINGSTAFKERLLAKLGWDVLVISYQEWGNKKGKAAWIRRKLQEQGWIRM